MNKIQHMDHELGFLIVIWARGTKVQGFFVCRTMTDNECYILGNMSKSEFREFRALIIEMVLHTGDRDSHWSGIFGDEAFHWFIVEMVLSYGAFDWSVIQD
jgi:hypothetical protein